MSDKAKKRTSQKEEQMKEGILKQLKEQGRMAGNKIAESLGIAPATASKYLGILEAEGKVKKNEDQPPYKYWSLNEDRNAEKSR